MKSLRAAGFTMPHLFIDDCRHQLLHEYLTEYPSSLITAHWPALGPFAKWAVSLWELYARNPNATRYALFQDDILAVSNLRAYLDSLEYPSDGYWNLCTYPANDALNPNKVVGWYTSNQRGLGAQGLVFDRETVLTLLKADTFVDRPMHPTRGWKLIDGGVVNTLTKKGRKEFVHYPSLVYHLGIVSSFKSVYEKQPTTASFPGESFDARTLIKGI